MESHIKYVVTVNSTLEIGVPCCDKFITLQIKSILYSSYFQFVIVMYHTPLQQIAIAAKHLKLHITLS